MSRLSHRLLGGPDPLTYLNNVKASFRDAGMATFHIFLSEVDAWIREQKSSDIDFARLSRIATLLQFKPHLLQGFNTLLHPNHRLECSTNVEIVRYFVIVTPKGARIISPMSSDVPFPASDAELRSLVLLKTWKSLLGAPEEESWLICIAALLQVILDDPTTDVICYSRAYSCLRELTEDSILAPSVLINNLKLEPGHAIHSDAFANIYKSSLAGITIRFRVLHMFDKKIEKTENLYKDLCSEVVTWRQLNHPNIVPFIGVSTELFSPRFCFLSSWASYGDLMSYLKRHPEHDRFNSICEIVDGIRYLHSLNPPIAHKDIKGANIHINDRLVCCLADFGLSTIVESQPFRRQLPAFQGSVCWTAPEIMDPARSQQRNPQAGDIYSLACTIFEVYTGAPPLFSMHKLSATLMRAVLRGERPELPPPGTWTTDEEELWWLVGHCWVDKPQDRPTINLIKQALRDIRVAKNKDLPDVSIGDASDLAGDLVAVEAWLKDEAVKFGMILSTYLQNVSSFKAFKMDSDTKPNVRLGDKHHPSPRQRLFSGQNRTAALQRFFVKVEASHQTAETSDPSNLSPVTSNRASDDSLPSLPPALQSNSLPTPPTSPALAHVSPSCLRPDAPPYVPLGALKVSSRPLGTVSAAAPLFVPTRHFQQNNSQPEQAGGSEALLYGVVKPLVDNPANTGALRQFLVHKLALYSLVRREAGPSI